MNAIREVLSQGDATFGVLLEKTGLSRRALASNLKRLVKMGELKRWVDEKDHRKRYYSLEDYGWERFTQQKVSQKLRQTELASLGFIMDVIVEYVAAALIAESKVIELEGHIVGKSGMLPKLTEYEKTLFVSCFRGRAYARNNENVGFHEALQKFLAMIKLVAERKDIDIKLLKGVPDIVFEFKFSKDVLIEKYENLKKAGKISSTQDFLRICKSISEKDFAEFLKTIGIENWKQGEERQS
jgi:DNA-binding MarR family transcriptional regulator